MMLAGYGIRMQQPLRRTLVHCNFNRHLNKCRLKVQVCDATKVKKGNCCRVQKIHPLFKQSN